jgi:hypothetical protein
MILAGCATIVRGSTEQVTFDSEPSGAEMRSTIKPACGNQPCQMSGGGASGVPYPTEDTPVVIESGPSCVTPCTIEVARNKELIVTFTKEGYEPQTVPLLNKLSSGAVATAGNAILGGVVGVVVDAGTQAGFDHYPNPLKVTLKPIKPASPVKPPKRKSS